MRQILLVTILACSSIITARAQNLVPNPSFEDYNTCPAHHGEISHSPTFSNFQTVQSWVNPIKLSTPDYFHACAPSPSFSASSVSVPANFSGYQQAHTGAGYCGIIPYSSVNNTNYAEYIATKLTEPLEAGRRYEVSFFVSYTYDDFSVFQNDLVAIDKIGAHFSDTLLNYTTQSATGYVIPLPFHIVHNGNVISDTATWTRISGIYHARGGEQYMAIGTFFDGSPIAKMYFPVNTVNPDYSYYYIDDVSVTELPGCDTVVTLRDTVLCRPAPFHMVLTPDSSGLNYLWNTGATTATLSISQPGRYWRVAGVGCNLYTDTINVAEAQHTLPDSRRDTIVCPADSVILRSANTGAVYNWSTADTTPVITVRDTGVYICNSIKACTLQRELFHVRQPAYQLYMELGEDTAVCAEDNFILQGITQPGLSYRWNTGDVACCIRPLESGQYTLTISDQCYSNTDSVHINVTRCRDCFFIPSAFTPNQDGVNDFFPVIPRCDIKQFQLKIFNRWGNLIFQSLDINRRWDGRFKNQLCETGTYYYDIIYHAVANKPPQMIKGDVLLIR